MSESSFLNGRVVLHAGDSRDVLKTLADNSIDSIVTDPPYALVSIQKRFGKPGSAAPLEYEEYAHKGANPYKRASTGFMGKQWDTGETAFAVEFWAQCLRVLKPGGHVVAFSGTRTYHRMACAIEDAGFEIRDQLQWVYGSGFPKSHDVSKGIDRAAGAEREVVGERELWGNNAKGGRGGQYANGYAGEADGSKKPMSITAPATASALQWQGWGTALKPSCEPICFGRKPLSEKTVAANVLAHGVGAINIDGCRVDLNGENWSGNQANAHGDYSGKVLGKFAEQYAKPSNTLGRWPANLLHDGSDEVLAGFPICDSPRANGNPNERTKGTEGMFRAGDGVSDYRDTGSAARFFYTSKADSDDRLGSKHPTVKPVDLMQWLCRLVTPKGGTVMDPFAGTGTTGEAAFREGFKAVLIEREAEYQADIRRRMALCMSGPDERKRESIKAKVGDLPFEPGSLFASIGGEAGND